MQVSKGTFQPLKDLFFITFLKYFVMLGMKLRLRGSMFKFFGIFGLCTPKWMGTAFQLIEIQHI